MHDTAPVHRVVMLYLWCNDIPDAPDGMVIIDRPVLKHELIDKVVVIQRRQEIQHPIRHRHNGHHDDATVAIVSRSPIAIRIPLFSHVALQDIDWDTLAQAGKDAEEGGQLNISSAVFNFWNRAFLGADFFS